MEGLGCAVDKMVEKKNIEKAWQQKPDAYKTAKRMDSQN